MSDIDVKSYLDQLKRVLPCVPPISKGPLKALHAAQSYKGMVQLIKKAMNIEDVTFLVSWVPEGAAQQSQQKDAPAWVQLPRLPDKLPFYGTKAFKETSLKIFFRKPFLERHTYDQVAIVIAHELSHVVLDSIRHPLHREEKAVDLTAMLLGFRLLYLSGAHKEHRTSKSIQTETIGYLSPAEVQLANHYIEQSHADSKTVSSASGFAQLKAVVSRFSLLSGFVIFCIVAPIAIWLYAIKSGHIARTPATKLPSGTQLNVRTERGQSGAMKATLPQDLVDRLGARLAPSLAPSERKRKGRIGTIR